MGVKRRDAPLGELVTSKGGTRYHPDISTPIRCKACNRLMDPSFAIEGSCPNCNKDFSRHEWMEMAAESMQVKTQGGWDREKLERFEDEQTGNSAYIAPDGTTHEQDEVARNIAKWAHKQKRRAEKYKKVKTWGGSGVNDILLNNPYLK